jgi:hypothetical protein
MAKPRATKPRVGGPAAAPPRTVIRTVITMALAAVLAASLAGCGSGVTPKTWAKSVCVALTPWRTKIATLTGQAQGQITGGSTPAQAKQSLMTLLAGARDASETARKGVADAGTPDVDEGAKIAARFVATLAAARDAYGHAGTTVSTLDTKDQRAFYDAVASAFDRLNTEYATSALDTRDVGSAELQKAFSEVPECR